MFIRNIGLALLALFCLPPSTFPQKGKSQFPSTWGSYKSRLIRGGRDSLPRIASCGAKIPEEIKVDTSKLIQIQRIDVDSLKAEKREIKALRKSFSDGKSYYLNRVDTSKLVQIQRIEDFDTKSTFYFAEVDSNHCGVLNEDLEWIIEPKYCAIAEYDPEKCLASVRACPFSYSYQNMSYWENEPAYNNWGVVDTAGNWKISPKYYEPFDLKTRWQMARNCDNGQPVAIVDLKEMWLGTYQSVVPFGEDAFILKNENKVGVRNHAGNYQVEMKQQKLIFGSESLYFFDSSQVCNTGEIKLTRFNLDHELDTIMGFKACIGVVSRISVISELEGAYVSVVNENISNRDYLVKDSAFALWFMINYWNDLFGSTVENMHLDQMNNGNIESVFADTIYTNKPSDFHEFYRTEETENWFDLSLNGEATYSILQHQYTVNYGSRGPAYENMEYSMVNVQIARGSAFELELADCFKNKDSSILKKYLLTQMPDSFNIYWENIKLNEAFWQVKPDSLVFYFPKTAMSLGYSEFDYDYQRMSISRKKFGRRFLNEKRRKRQLLKQ